MNAIANFKKRHQAQRELQNNTADEAGTPAPKNEALTLLAALMGCSEDEALEKARKAVEAGVRHLEITVELAAGDETTGDETEKPEPQNDTVTADLERAASGIESSAGTVEGAADAVSGAAEQIASAAGGLEDTASQLAYSAEDIGQVTAELKEATAELKKPLEAPKSSRGGKAAPRKSNSKKSG